MGYLKDIPFVDSRMNIIALPIQVYGNPPYRFCPPQFFHCLFGSDMYWIQSLTNIKQLREGIEQKQMASAVTICQLLHSYTSFWWGRSGLRGQSNASLPAASADRGGPLEFPKGFCCTKSFSLYELLSFIILLNCFLMFLHVWYQIAAAGLLL